MKRLKNRVINHQYVIIVVSHLVCVRLSIKINQVNFGEDNKSEIRVLIKNYFLQKKTLLKPMVSMIKL